MSMFRLQCIAPGDRAQNAPDRHHVRLRGRPRPRQAYDDSHSVAWPEAWRKHRNSLFLMCRAGFIVCSAGQRKHAVILV